MKNLTTLVGLTCMFSSTAALASVAQPIPLPGAVLLLAIGAGAWGAVRFLRRRS